jgi:phage terminase large subunit GpA-like protein
VWPKRPPKPKDRAKLLTPFIVGVDAAKEAITNRLRLAAPGPGYCHFPVGRDLDYFRQLGAERLLKTWRRGVPIREWRKDPGVRNEALDCRVYAYAALQGFRAMGWKLEREEEPQKPAKADTRSTTIMPKLIKSRWME